MGKITKIAVACASFSRIPVVESKGTAIIPPPPPNRLFAAPTSVPRARRLPDKRIVFFILFLPNAGCRGKRRVLPKYFA